MAEDKPRLAPAPPKRQDASLVDLSRGGALRAVIYGRGYVILMRGETLFKLTDQEADALERARARSRKAEAPE